METVRALKFEGEFVTVKEFKLGDRCKAIGDCGMTKDVEVVGKLVKLSNGYYGIETRKHRVSSINKNTLEYA